MLYTVIVHVFAFIGLFTTLIVLWTFARLGYSKMTKIGAMVEEEL